MRVVLVEKDAYFDSVFLMRVSSEIKQLPGVAEGVVVLGTEPSKSQLAELGFIEADLAGASSNDLIIAVEAQSQSACEAAVALVRHNLKPTDRTPGRATAAPKTLRSAP